MARPPWDRFEWDDEDKKNGNVQHLRDHGIEPPEAKRKEEEKAMKKQFSALSQAEREKVESDYHRMKP